MGCHKSTGGTNLPENSSTTTTQHIKKEGVRGAGEEVAEAVVMHRTRPITRFLQARAVDLVVTPIDATNRTFKEEIQKIR